MDAKGAERITDITNILTQLNDRLSRIETALNDGREPAFQKEWYTVAEAAEILSKAPFTVREWARLARINAMKRPSGRGAASEWMISHSEIERIQNKGLLPRDL
ncbi:helix-turn-helix domain-containing protein [Bythopirellula polymerisocia]|uniref:Helix-turn-helix domain protein n=1 Tax=Bythopirellula polymerisocia TaxID=2528003 RepID=A0A5C6CCV3_9BACT|nr:helix-turn-helix domain-containing protein [Bythopirellula polymerisocia]TWU21311.1 Helix-turn-helix domain protein [Bythopirellula polymerisocia]